MSRIACLAGALACAAQMTTASPSPIGSAPIPATKGAAAFGGFSAVSLDASRVQQELVSLGFNLGAIDGLRTDKTEDALKGFADRYARAFGDTPDPRSALADVYARCVTPANAVDSNLDYCNRFARAARVAPTDDAISDFAHFPDFYAQLSCNGAGLTETDAEKLISGVFRDAQVIYYFEDFLDWMLQVSAETLEDSASPCSGDGATASREAEALGTLEHKASRMQAYYILSRVEKAHD